MTAPAAAMKEVTDIPKDIDNTVRAAIKGEFGFLAMVIAIVVTIYVVALVILFTIRWLLFQTVKANEQRLEATQWDDPTFLGFLKGNNPAYSDSWFSPFDMWNDVMILKGILARQAKSLAAGEAPKPNV